MFTINMLGWGLFVMIRLLACAALVASTSTAALSADLFAPPPLVDFKPGLRGTVVEPWHNAYVGVSGGYGWGETEVTDAALRLGDDRLVSDASTTADSDGFIAGITVGANVQAGRLVFGAEADVSYTDLSSSYGQGFVDPRTGATLLNSGDVDLTWLSTLRARAGIAMDRFMVYGTGGVALGRIEVDGLVDYAPAGALPFDFSHENTQVGYTLGAGIEAFLAPNVTAKVEYLYVDLGKDTYTGTFANGDAFSTKIGYDAHIVRGGLNYSFAL